MAGKASSTDGLGVSVWQRGSDAVARWTSNGGKSETFSEVAICGAPIAAEEVDEEEGTGKAT